MLLAAEGQTGEARIPATKPGYFGNRGALNRNVLVVGHLVFKAGSGCYFSSLRIAECLCPLLTAGAESYVCLKPLCAFRSLPVDSQSIIWPVG